MAELKTLREEESEGGVRSRGWEIGKEIGGKGSLFTTLDGKFGMFDLIG